MSAEASDRDEDAAVPAGGDQVALGRLLKHHDRSQLPFQISEIVGQRTYLQGGIEVHQGDVVLDVGANVGVAAAFFASACGAGVVHSFEPVGPIFDLLRENARHFPACVPHPYGLSRAAGQAEITYYPAATAMSGLYADPERDRALARDSMITVGVPASMATRRAAERYEAVTLDCELRTLSEVLDERSIDRVHLLKIDVERAELDVLEGIDVGDWPRIEQVAVEAHDEGSFDAVVKTLRGHGLVVTSSEERAMEGTGVHMVYGRRR